MMPPNISHPRPWLLRQAILAALLPAACCIMAACTTNSSTTMATSRPGDGLEQDPLGYKPQIDELNISGGGLGNFDKNAFNKDLHDVFDP
jgi:hypothetical protein